MSHLSSRLSDSSDEICKLSAVAKRYVSGGAWTMAAAMFKAINKLSRRSSSELKLGVRKTVRASQKRTVRKNYRRHRTNRNKRSR